MFLITSNKSNIVYQPNCEQFSVLSATLTETLNDSGQLTFIMPITNNFYDEVVEGTTKIELWQDDAIIWRGFVESTSINFRRDKKVNCIGELSYLSRSIQPQSRFNFTPQALLNRYITKHNSQNDEQFLVGNVMIDDESAQVHYTDYDTTLDAIRNKICDGWNAYVKIRYGENDERYIDLLSIENYGDLNTQIVQFGENLLDYVNNRSTLDIYSQVLPLGARLDNQLIPNLDNYLTIESVNGGVAFLTNDDIADKFGKKMKVVRWDDVTDANNLKSKATTWLSTQQLDNAQIELNAIDLSVINSSVDNYKLGDRVRVISSPFNLDVILPIMSKTTDLLNPTNNKIEIGNNVQLSYTQMQSQKTSDNLKQNDAWSGSISIGENITMNGGDAANVIRFLSNNHNSFFYGGNDGSSISIGCWDGNGGNAIWRYQDTTGKLALYCGGSLNNLEDMVIDSGTSDGWDYVKYASGIYTCSKRMSMSIAINTAQGSIYYGDSPTISLPITFASVPTINANGEGASTTNAWYSVINATTSNCKVRGWRGTSASSSSYGVGIKVMGRWK